MPLSSNQLSVQEYIHLGLQMLGHPQAQTLQLDLSLFTSLSRENVRQNSSSCPKTVLKLKVACVFVKEKLIQTVFTNLSDPFKHQNSIHARPHSTVFVENNGKREYTISYKMCRWHSFSVTVSE
jgi:hypothetical protein